MKVLIAYGAGMDSTALAYEILRDTTHEVVLLYIDEEHQYADSKDWRGHAEREKECMRACAAWLAENVRPVAEVRVIPTRRVMPLKPTRPSREVRYRVREGYGVATSAYVHWGINRFVTKALEVEELGDVDEVLSAFNIWDTDNDFMESFWQPSYEGITDVPMRFPYLTVKGDGSYEGIGRFELQSRIPEDLFALTIQCHMDPPCGECWRCKLNAYYDEHCAGKSLEEIRAVDDALHRKYFLGPYANEADPETYDMFDKYKL